MTDIDVPDWVLSAARSAFGKSYYDEGNTENVAMRAAIGAALSAWVVPVGYVSRKALEAVSAPPFYGCDTYISAAEQAIVVSDQIYTLRQEKPE